MATYHSVFEPGPLLGIFGRAMRWSLAKLDTHVVVAPACVDSLTRYFPFDYRYIPNGVDTDRYRPDVEPSDAIEQDGKHVILFLGRFDPKERPGDRAARVPAGPRRARRERAPGHLRRGPAQAPAPPPPAGARRCGRGLGRADRLVAPRVLPRGRCLHPLPARRLQHGAARGDGLGRTGRGQQDPRLRARRRTRRPGPSGRRLLDADSFAESLLYLLDRPAEQARMGVEGRRRALETYSLDTVTDQYEALYHDLPHRIASQRRVIAEPEAIPG